jgi:hypothetical protein
MRKTIVAGLVGLVAGGGLLLAHPASAVYDGSNCAGSPIVTVPPVTIPGSPPTTVLHGGGKIYGPSGDQIVCADDFAADTANAFQGGALEAGVANNGPRRLCFPVDVPPVTSNQAVPLPPQVPGVYAIADGDNLNQANLSGYAGLSSNESSGANENCHQNNGGGGTNSGGSVGLKVLQDNNLPIPFVVCGFTSGPNNGNTGRDGCYIP